MMSRKHKGSGQNADLGTAKRPPAEHFVADSRLVAARELLDRARERVTFADVRSFAPDDPGVLGYIAAFEAIVKHGAFALRDDFDVTETIALTRWTHASSQASARTRFRWFRVLTSAAGILINGLSLTNYSLATLLVDLLALRDEGQKDVPIHLVAPVCREIRGKPAGQVEERTFCFLAELLLAGANGLDEVAIMQLCSEMEKCDRSVREDDFSSRAFSEFVWGPTCFDQLHPVWLDLVERLFPIAPPATEVIKQRLLSEGARWRGRQRLLS